jgi:hypothetical protein
MIDRLLYTATALALACVFVFDPAFSANLFRALNEGGFVLPPFNPWETGAASIFLALAVIALWREWRR